MASLTSSLSTSTTADRSDSTTRFVWTVAADFRTSGSVFLFTDLPYIVLFYQPDYSYLRKLFRDLFVREAFQYDYVFDWSVSVTRASDDAIPAPGAAQAQPPARASGRRVITGDEDQQGAAQPGVDRQ